MDYTQSNFFGAKILLMLDAPQQPAPPSEITPSNKSNEADTVYAFALT
jgi:hypothetical protein